MSRRERKSTKLVAYAAYGMRRLQNTRAVVYGRTLEYAKQYALRIRNCKSEWNNIKI